MVWDGSWRDGGAFIAQVVAQAALVVTGCSGPTEQTVQGPPPISEADLPAAYADAYCGVYAKCCAAAGLPFDAQGCAQIPPPSKPSPPYWTAFDPARAGQCVALVRSGGETCTVAPRVAQDTAGICDFLYLGSQALGEECGQPIDCAGTWTGTADCGGTQLSDGGFGVPRCVPITFGGRGDLCFGEVPGMGTGKVYPACATGLYCKRDGVCVDKGRAGDPCDPPFGMSVVGCVEGLECVNATCMRLIANGGACKYYNECQSGMCQGGVCLAGEPVATAQSCAAASAGR